MTSKATGRVWRTALAALLGATLGAVEAWADAIPGDDSDSLTMTVTPDVNYSVDITTTDAIMGLGTVGLGQSTWTVRPATVTFGGTVLTGHELKLNASISAAGGGTAWSLDATPSTAATPNDGASAEANALALYALFTSTKVPTAPTAAAFGRPDAASGLANTKAAVTAFGDQAVGVAGTVANTVCTDAYEYCLGTADENKNMDDNRIGTANDGDMRRGNAHLWFYLRLPSSTTTGTQQSILVTLTHKLGV